jgi:uncharacterized protein YjbI with pentapeptide repeats/DNA-binding XRE family transcriptional regulator
MEAKIIGSKIAMARKEKSLTQAGLARQLFISPQAIGKWERGESIPDIIMLNRLSKILGVDLNYFSGDFKPAASEVLSVPGNHTEDKESSDQHDINTEGRPLLTRFSGSNLTESDFSGVMAHNRKFSGSDLHGSDFSAADLTGSSFSGSDAQDATFDKANLTDCTFHAVNLIDTSFRKTILIRTAFSASDLTRAEFIGIEMIDVNFTRMDLRKTVFENCVFRGADFKSSDLSGVCFDGQIFTDVKFDNTALQKTTFKGATLKNVSFQATFALTNRFYSRIKNINFEGAKMDKLTYASLKGMGADLSSVTVL